ncbi:hypothetical protein ACIBEJ_00325 [Nonomuraea sp. NPDC050790]|uniref:hypothetical protein n=1 Tax=Nonomuraea sp. NPDC050790 TaxID=3364371 RepID=UPI0037A2BA88
MVAEEFWRAADGSVTARTVEGGEPGDAPADAVRLTRKQYERELRSMQAAHQEKVAQFRQEDADRARSEFAALQELGVPEALARRLAGLTEEAA